MDTADTAELLRELRSRTYELADNSFDSVICLDAYEKIKELLAKVEELEEHYADERQGDS